MAMRQTRQKVYTKDAAKSRVIELVQQGYTIKAACEAADRSLKTHEEWRRLDPKYAAAIDQAKALQGKRDVQRGERLGFAEFRKKYLNEDTFWHQLQWVDLLEGREPRDLHPAQTYSKGKSSRVLVNVPPFHCATLDTPVLTTEGWRTVGDIERGDFVFGPSGRPAKVFQTWEAEVDVFEVEFNTGDIIRTDGEHQWVVQRSANHARKEMTTRQIMADLRSPSGQFKWRIPVASPVGIGRDELGAPLPPPLLDPYVLGYWLGDGDTNSSRLAVGEQDKDDLLAQLDKAGLEYSIRPQRGGHSVYIRGIRKHLTALGVLGHKHIPDVYATASWDDRLSLLQGLLDSDGTIRVRDGCVKFSQNVTRTELAWDVYRLVASLGYQPRMRRETRDAISPTTRLPYVSDLMLVTFKPNTGDSVFRLERKALRQTINARTKTAFRTIVDVRPAGKDMVRCLTVDSDGNEYLLGDGCIRSHNAKTMTITVDYATYRLCMDPSYRIILVSETSTLAEDFLYAIKTRLTHPDYLELQKAYAPDGGWQATAHAWTNARVTFGGDQREGGEKDPNVQAIGMGSQIYGRRADLIVLDDSVTGKNVREWSKQMTWLRREVASRLEMGGKLLVIGTRIAPVDLYSQLMNPDNYANGKVPWTHMASPAILEEGGSPDEHKTLWPYASQPWVRSEDDECDCGTELCREGFERDGLHLYPRWDGLHLEIGPRADNNASEWALVYQQKSVSEDATFPEHKVARATNSLRLCGILKKDMTGHPLGGMHNKYVIAGLDPSIKGFAGMLVIAVDRETQKRFLLNAWNIKAPTKDQLVQKMQEVTEHYGVHEWRVEKTGLLQFFTQDSVMRQWFNTRGVKFTEHHTGASKWDPTFGVSSLASLFGDCTRSAQDSKADWEWINEPLLELPRPNKPGAQALVHQLVTWTPDLDPNKVPCDMVMALWFAEIGAREHLGYGRGAGSLTVFGRSNRFTSPRRNSNRQTVRLADYRGAGN